MRPLMCKELCLDSSLNTATKEEMDKSLNFSDLFPHL